MSAALLRYPSELDERLDALLACVRRDEEFRAVRLSRSAILRMLVYEGLPRMERRYGIIRADDE